MKIRALIRSFSVFSLIGAVFYVLAVALNGVAIDVMALDPFWAPLCIILGLFVLKYYIYLWTRTVTPRFWRYTFANIGVTLLTSITITLLVERAGMDGWLASALAIGAFMVLRYAVLYWTGVINRST